MPIEPDIVWELDERNLGLIKGEGARFIALEASLLSQTAVAVGETAVLLAHNLRDEFAIHDQTGKDENEPEGYVHTIDTIEIQYRGLEATVRMGGAAVWVEFGTKPHRIPVEGEKLMHWTGGKYGEGDHFAFSVNHPGYEGDDFAERAIEHTNLDAIATGLFRKAFAQSFITAT